MKETKEELIEQLNQIREKKQKALEARSYKTAAELRDSEIPILEKLINFYDIDLYINKNGK
jgi:hypothetical protein